MYGVFENEVVMTVIEHKWNTYVKDMFRRHMYCDMAMVFFMTVDAVVHKSVVNQWTGTVTPWTIIYYLPMVMTLCLWFFFTKQEVVQMISTESFREHVKDVWNLSDVVSLFSVFVAYSLRAFEAFFGEWNFLTHHGMMKYNLSTTAMAVALPLTFINTLYYMQGIDKKSGQLVRMILGILSGVKVSVQQVEYELLLNIF